MENLKYNFDYSELRGRIRTKLGTEGEYAKKLERTPQYISAVFNNNTTFDMLTIKKSCDLLDIKIEEIGFYFFKQKVNIS